VARVGPRIGGIAVPLQQGLQVLMVEDQRVDAMLLRKLLYAPATGAGRVDHAESLTGAINLLRDRFYDAVILDLGLPDSDGIAAVSRIGEEFPAVAIIVLTGRDEERIGLEAMAAGAQDKLTKGGIDGAQLAHSVHYAVARQRLDEEQRRSAVEHRALFDDNPYPVWVYDVDTLRFLAVNEAALREYGYTRAQFLSMTLRHIRPEEDIGLLDRDIETSAVAGMRTDEWRHRRSDGTVFDVEINAQPIEFRGHRARIVLARDITMRKRAIALLEVSERRFRKLFQYSLGLICTHDLDGTLLSINPAAARTLGYSIAELMGRNLSEFVPPLLRLGFGEYLRRIAANGSDSGLLHVVSKDGEHRIWQYHNVLDNESPGETYVLGHAQDITERRQYERRLKDQSVRDPLTGCHNRRFLEEHVAALDRDASWGCILVDLDHFKQINDTLGHQRGDEVLIGIGRFLLRHARANDFIVRMGGDEFLMLLSGADEATAAQIAARLRASASQAPSGFTIGWAVRQPGESLESTINRADKDLYTVRTAARSLQPVR
jgi:diguanylate cyclase (GGDEF)-like protein/PAS domain S-box-containing protein